MNKKKALLVFVVLVGTGALFIALFPYATRAPHGAPSGDASPEAATSPDGEMPETSLQSVEELLKRMQPTSVSSGSEEGSNLSSLVESMQFPPNTQGNLDRSKVNQLLLRMMPVPASHQ